MWSPPCASGATGGPRRPGRPWRSGTPAAGTSSRPCPRARTAAPRSTPPRVGTCHWPQARALATVRPRGACLRSPVLPEVLDEEPVSVAGTSPTARQRELGARLRGFRIERGMTVEHVANELLCSATKISRLETGARRPSLRDVRKLCTLYELDETTSPEPMSMARGAREPGCCSRYEDINLHLYIALDQE